MVREVEWTSAIKTHTIRPYSSNRFRMGEVTLTKVMDLHHIKAGGNSTTSETIALIKTTKPSAGNLRGNICLRNFLLLPHIPVIISTRDLLHGHRNNLIRFVVLSITSPESLPLDKRFLPLGIPHNHRRRE